MGYTLRACIAPEGAFSATPPLPGSTARPVRLGHGLALWPLPDDELDAVEGAARAADPVPGFVGLPAAVVRWLEALSRAGPAAFVEAEYFGGVGQQAAALWESGGLALGPLFCSDADAEEAAAVEAGVTLDEAPINAALARLGVRPDGQRDAFAVVGLDRYRSTGAWAGRPD
jgi:hypothetical protein